MHQSFVNCNKHKETDQHHPVPGLMAGGVHLFALFDA